MLSRCYHRPRTPANGNGCPWIMVSLERPFVRQAKLMTVKDKACIVGVGATEFGRRGQFADRTEVEQVRTALGKALEDSGLTRQEIDGFCTYSGGSWDPAALAPALGIPNVTFSSMVYGGGGGGTCAAVAHAAAGIAAGYANVVLVWKVIAQPPQMRFGASFSRASTPDRAATFQNEFIRPFGLMAPGQMFSMMVRRHMHRFGTKPVHLAEIAVAHRAHAVRNPKALMRSPMTIEDHQSSRMISDPFRLFDYCQENDGGVAILVTSAERARSLKQRPVYITAAAEGGESAWGRGMITQNQPEDLYTSAGMAHLAKRLYAMAGVEPKDIDVAELYDHFSGMVILQLEDWGFCKKGEGGPFVENGGTRWPDGRLPVNTHGGNLSEVYLLGMTHIVEGVKQMRGTSTSQVKDAELALVTSGPSPLPMGALILRR